MTSKKTFQRMLSMLLLACMLMSLAPGFASAEAEIEGEPAAEAAVVEEMAEALEETAEAVEEETVEPVVEEVAEAVEEETVEPETVAEETPVEEAVEIQPVAVEAALDAQAAAEETAEPAAAIVEESAAPQAATYYIHYYDNDGYTGGSWKKAHTAGETVDLSEGKKYVSHSPNPKLDSSTGYCTLFTLAAWNTAKSGTGTRYELTDTITMPEEDVHLYAIWAESEQKHWEMTVEGPGSVEYMALRTSASSNEIETLREGGLAKLYVSNTNKVYPGLIRTGFTPTADEGYIFDGWYFYEVSEENKQEVTQLTNPVLQELTLTNAIVEAGRNKIIARFIEPDETCAKLTFTGTDNGIAEKFMYLKKGSNMPEIESPTWKNHFFLGWEPELPAVVPEVDTTYAAKWLEGPTSENTVEPMFYLRCVSGDGIGDETHDPQPYSWFFCKSNDDISFDGTNYVCTATLDNSSIIGTGPGCYDILSGQEHFLVDKDAVINLFWNGEKWAPADGAQYFDVYHYTEVPAETVASVTPVIYVVDSENTETYKALSLLEDTYEITYYDSLGGISTAASGSSAVLTITDFDAYAKQLGEYYVPVDLEAEEKLNLYSAEEYAFYFSRTQGTGSIVNGSTYATWSKWSYDGQSEFKDGSVLDQSVYGKELLVKDMTPKCTITFTDEYGILPTQTFEVKIGNPYPKYNWTDERIDPDVLAALEAEKPIQIGDAWYTFAGWDDYPLAFGSVPTVSEDETFTASWEPAAVRTVTFTDGADGTVFEPVKFVIFGENGALPWAGYRFEDGNYDLEAFVLNEVCPDLYDTQLDDGSVFVDILCSSNEEVSFWDFADSAAVVTEDLDFEIMWGKFVEVIYRDGADGEVFDDFDMGSYLVGFDEFPEYPEEIPEREGYTFVDWVSVKDEDADSYEEEDGHTVNVYVEEGFRSFCIFLDAQWAPTATLKAATVMFEGQIHLRYTYVLPEELLALPGAYIAFEKDGEEILRTLLSEGDNSTAGVTMFYCPVMIPSFADEITTKLYTESGQLIPVISGKGVDYTNGFTYSVKEYAEKKKDSGSTQEMRDLAKALYDYGTAAQIYFKYGEYTGLAVDSAVTAVPLDTLSEYAPVTVGDKPAGIEKAEISVFFESNNTLWISFTLDGTKELSAYTFTRDGKTVKARYRDENRYYLEVANVAAPNLAVPHHFTVTDGTDTFEVTTSVLGYAYTSAVNGSDARKDLGRALYLYWQAAAAYFG